MSNNSNPKKLKRESSKYGKPKFPTLKQELTKVGKEFTALLHTGQKSKSSVDEPQESSLFSPRTKEWFKNKMAKLGRNKSENKNINSSMDNDDSDPSYSVSEPYCPTLDDIKEAKDNQDDADNKDELIQDLKAIIADQEKIIRKLCKFILGSSQQDIFQPDRPKAPVTPTPSIFPSHSSRSPSKHSRRQQHMHFFESGMNEEPSIMGMEYPDENENHIEVEDTTDQKEMSISMKTSTLNSHDPSLKRHYLPDESTASTSLDLDTVNTITEESTTLASSTRMGHNYSNSGLYSSDSLQELLERTMNFIMGRGLAEISSNCEDSFTSQSYTKSSLCTRTSALTANSETVNSRTTSGPLPVIHDAATEVNY